MVRQVHTTVVWEVRLTSTVALGACIPNEVLLLLLFNCRRWLHMLDTPQWEP